MSLDGVKVGDRTEFAGDHLSEPRELRMLVRLHAERWGVGEQVADRLVDLVNVMLGPGTAGARLLMEETKDGVKVTARFRSSGSYESFCWWRVQHPLGPEHWSQFMDRVADGWKEQRTPHPLVFARVTRPDY